LHSGCNANPFTTDLSNFLNRGELDRRTASAYEDIQVLSDLFKNENNQDISKKSIVNGLKKIKDRSEDKKISSEVYKDNKKISFLDNGDRIEITGRVIVTPTAKGEGFTAVDNNCTPY
jgi:hypothetical protein